MVTLTSCLIKLCISDSEVAANPTLRWLALRGEFYRTLSGRASAQEILLMLATSQGTYTAVSCRPRQHKQNAAVCFCWFQMSLCHRPAKLLSQAIWCQGAYSPHHIGAWKMAEVDALTCIAERWSKDTLKSGTAKISMDSFWPVRDIVLIRTTWENRQDQKQRAKCVEESMTGTKEIHY